MRIKLVTMDNLSLNGPPTSNYVFKQTNKKFNHLNHKFFCPICIFVIPKLYNGDLVNSIPFALLFAIQWVWNFIHKKKKSRKILYISMICYVCVCVHHIYNWSKSSFPFIHMYFGKCLCFSDDAVAVLIFKIFRVFFVVFIWNRSIFVGSLGISNILEAYEIDIQWRSYKTLAAYLIALLQNTVYKCMCSTFEFETEIQSIHRRVNLLQY